MRTLTTRIAAASIIASVGLAGCGGGGSDAATEASDSAATAPASTDTGSGSNNTGNSNTATNSSTNNGSSGPSTSSGTSTSSDQGATQTSSGAARVTSARVIATFPHDSDAFTQGLFFHEGTVYESTGGYGVSSLRRVTIQNGETVQRAMLPGEFFGEGITLLGNRIYQLTLWGETGLIYDVDTLSENGRFYFSGSGWGITNDGSSLITSDGSHILRFIDPATYNVTRILTVTDNGMPITALNELEWIRGEIWANIWQSNRIARIDPQSGRVKEWIDLSAIVPPAAYENREAVLNGIAYDAATGRVFVTGKLWPSLFQIEIP